MGCVRGPALGVARLFFFLPPCQEEWFSAQNFSGFSMRTAFPNFPWSDPSLPPVPRFFG